ncbi:MAG: hypothetical protein ACYCT2_04825 [Thermoplasmataceae archaeon]
MLAPPVEIPEEFFSSCRKYLIDDETARKLAEQFRQEFARLPVNFGEVLEVLE